MGVPSTRISVVPCGVDTGLFTPDGPAEEKGRPFRILTVGRLVPRKGVGLTISALARLVDSGRDDVELVVLGGSRPPAEVLDDPDVQRLLAHAEGLGVADRVSFRGQIRQGDLPQALRSADVVVCAPWYEPFGIVPLEAMATGTPVVAAAVGGLIDSVVHGRTGLHVPPRDSDAIADAVQTLLDDPALLASLGAAGIARTHSRYTWSKVAAETERAYLRTLRAAGRADRGGWADRGGRAELSGARADLAGHADRTDRAERAGRTDRAERAGRVDQADRADRTDRTPRTARVAEAATGSRRSAGRSNGRVVGS
jgi:glycosyltransferase involved in cell wall biosynthesis